MIGRKWWIAATLLARSAGGLVDSSASLHRILETLADFQKLAGYLAV
jgi:hypothetical protein